MKAACAPVLSRDESSCGTKTNPIVIALWGPTGAGKSWLGNSLSALGGGDYPFPESESLKSCTKAPSSDLCCIALGRKSLWFQIVDLMGNADTDGESTEAVDQAVLAMKSYKPHLICLVEHGHARDNPIAAHSLKAMQMCVQGCWGEQNIIQVVNQVQPPKPQRGKARGAAPKDPQQVRQEMMEQRKVALQKLLGLTVTMQILVPAMVGQDDTELLEPLQAILNVASQVVNRVTVQGMQTFTEKQRYAKNLANDAICAERVAREAEACLRQQIFKLEHDVRWYESFIRGLEEAATMVCGWLLAPFTLGWSIGEAERAVEHQRNCARNAAAKLAQLRAEYERSQASGLAATLLREKEKYAAWTKELEDLSQCMHLKC